MSSIAIITALPEEIAPLIRRAKIEGRLRIGGRRCHRGSLRGVPVVLMSTGDGVARAGASLGELLRRVDVSRVIGIGIAGALSAELRPGDVIVADRVIGDDGSSEACGTAPMAGGGAKIVAVHTASAIAASAAAKRALAARYPEAAAVDTDSLGWVRAASAAGVPIAVCRVVFDTADEELPCVVAGDDGTINRGAVLWYALRHPAVIPDLLELRRRVRRCAETIADFVETAVAGTPDLEKFLQATSRTFALCIPLLPQPTLQQVTLAYLLFRIADTFEDATEWPVAVRVQALADFCALLRNPDPDQARRLASAWQASQPIAHAGYLDLLAHVPAVFEAFRSLPPEGMDIMRSHVIRSAEGMSSYVSRTGADGHLRLTGIDDLRQYCYTVAGIVGEMLTELFLLGSPEIAPAARELRERAATFGEALQLVNILKDAAGDRSEGRTYIPDDVPLADVFARARADLDVAAEYTLRMQREGAPRGLVEFTALPVELARATLDRVEKFGPGAKVSRPEVFRIVRRLGRSLDHRKPALQPSMRS